MHKLPLEVSTTPLIISIKGAMQNGIDTTRMEGGQQGYVKKSYKKKLPLHSLFEL